VRKLCKDNRLEAKWKENAIKVLTLRTSLISRAGRFDRLGKGDNIR